MREKLARIGGIVAINLLLLLFLVVVLELVAAQFVSRPGGNVSSHPRLNHTWKPNGSRLHREWIRRNPDFPEPYLHRYNAQGWLEEYDVSREKPPNTFRIFYLGDSFTEGTCPMDQSVPSVVERRINEQIGDTGWSVEVINTGTSSYSPSIFYPLFRYEILDYDPDLIVVNVDMTDVFDDWKYAQTMIVDDDGNPYAVPPRDVYSSPFLDTEDGVVRSTASRRILLFLYQHSHAVTLLLDWSRGLSDDARQSAKERGDPDNRGVDRWGWCRHRWTDAAQRDVDRTLDLLRRLVKLARDEGVAIALSGAPHYWQFAGRADGTGEPAWSARPHYELESLAAELGVPYLNSYDALAEKIRGTPQSQYYYVRDVHFNPRGYEIWADAHFEFLTDAENELLPAPILEALAGGESPAGSPPPSER